MKKYILVMQNSLLNCISCRKITSHKQQFIVNEYSILKCTQCGLGSAKIKKNLNFKEIYDKSYFEGGKSDGYLNYHGSKNVLKIEFNSIKNQILKYKPKLGTNLLEIGCAYGYLLETFSPLFKVYGIEISDHAINICHKKGLNVINADQARSLNNIGIFELVIMLDVIEHLIDPDNIFQQISACTKKDALLIISTGDFDSIVSLFFKKYWRLMTPPQHLWFYNKKSITKFLDNYGFRVESITYPFKFVPLNLIIFQICRYLGLQKYLKFLNIPGGLYINLFDAMRIVARKI